MPEYFILLNRNTLGP